MALIANDSDCIKDIKRLYPIAQKWVLFTTDFNNNFKTKISTSYSLDLLTIHYNIFDLDNKVVFRDIITIPIKIQKKKDLKLVYTVGAATLFIGIVSGLLINRSTE
jgi:hypothetical protein